MHKAIKSTVRPEPLTWTFSSPADWHRWIKTQSAMAKQNVKLNIIISPSI